jgi:3-oxoadipate enol-lactonase
VPERLDRLVLCSTAPKIGIPELWNSRIDAVRQGGMAAVANTVIERWFTPAFREAEAEVIERIRKMLLETPPEGYMATAAAVRDMDQRELLTRISAPTLVICGRYDPATPPEHSRFIAERVPGARLVEVEGSHLCNIEAAPDFDDALVAFLTGNSA